MTQPTYEVFLHGINAAGEHTDNPGELDRHEVYVLVYTPDDTEQPFDIRGEQTFPFRVLAMGHAHYLAEILTGDPNEFQSY